MQPFSHRFAKGSRVRFGRAPGGGLVSEMLIISANIPLERTDPNFDEAKVAELEAAAVMYANSQKDPYKTIVFESG